MWKAKTTTSVLEPWIARRERNIYQGKNAKAAQWLEVHKWCGCGVRSQGFNIYALWILVWTTGKIPLKAKAWSRLRAKSKNCWKGSCALLGGSASGRGSGADSPSSSSQSQEHRKNQFTWISAPPRTPTQHPQHLECDKASEEPSDGGQGLAWATAAYAAPPEDAPPASVAGIFPLSQIASDISTELQDYCGHTHTLRTKD